LEGLRNKVLAARYQTVAPDSAVFHPGAQAPPLAASLSHFRRNVGLLQVRVVDLRRVPRQRTGLLAKASDIFVGQGGDDGVRVGNRREFFKQGGAHCVFLWGSCILLYGLTVVCTALIFQILFKAIRETWSESP
jgi:hypothetical protein